ncbi:unnamed protein product [Microthlaspi erraticum]|uniref:FBD domain-containing protein n=1 Tax=Microthlaspi erraticum TaxID=1685480 RepID=A0A6D2L9D9_9BRAS|nr:unnamed protein product [Microthlaspi erraticum]
MKNMMEAVLLYFSLVHIGCEISSLVEQVIPILLEQTKQTSRRFFEKRRAKLCQRYEGEDRISALPDHLLVRILSLVVPTKEVEATKILSKRWRFVWTMVPRLRYIENNDGTRRIVVAGLLGRLLNPLLGKSDPKLHCVWWYLDKSLQLNKAPKLERLVIQLGQHCPVDVDVEKWIVNAVDRKVSELGFMLSWSAKPTKLPNSVYTCDTLVSLGLSDKILVDVPSSACFPSLKSLGLYFVLYKDKDSLVRFLSSCPVLKHLIVYRNHQDTAIDFKINVPSLECLSYDDTATNKDNGKSLVIDTLALKKLFLTYNSDGSCLIMNRPRFDKARIYVDCYLDDMFLRSLSSLTYLELFLSFTTVACCNAINFSKLMECKIILLNGLDWLDPLTSLLQNSPNLKVVFIDQSFIRFEEDFAVSWNQPSSVPGCLSAHLEIFEWKGYRGRSKEKEIVRYILANSECLKRAGISITCKRINRKKMMRELESMHRVSTSSQILFSTQLEYLDMEKEMTD